MRVRAAREAASPSGAAEQGFSLVILAKKIALHTYLARVPQTTDSSARWVMLRPTVLAGATTSPSLPSPSAVRAYETNTLSGLKQIEDPQTIVERTRANWSSHGLSEEQAAQIARRYDWAIRSVDNCGADQRKRSCVDGSNAVRDRLEIGDAIARGATDEIEQRRLEILADGLEAQPAGARDRRRQRTGTIEPQRLASPHDAVD